MGANEKHAATYHGGEYTPSELALITAWVDQRRNLLEYAGEPFEGVVERTAQAQRTLAKIRAEAKAEALEEAIDALMAGPEANLNPDGTIRPPHLQRSPRLNHKPRLRVANWLLRRANQYKENQS